MTNIFIDGSAGTTGLRIESRLCGRPDISLIRLPEEKRKDRQARAEALNSCDVAFLCLPDDAAREAVALVQNPSVTVIDASTAHRTDPRFAYGFPELSAMHRERVIQASRIAVPGCHASGFLALVAPLVACGLLSPEAALTCFSLTGYSGGGKSMISDYESEERPALFDAPRQYALGQTHKHLKEMKAVSALTLAPIFCPIVADFPYGMEVTVPLFAHQIKGTAEDIRALYRAQYRGPVVRYAESCDEGGFLSAAAFAGLDGMQVTVLGNEERILLVARYDNLGKGASGAALQCLNLKLGVPETEGLALKR